MKPAESIVLRILGGGAVRGLVEALAPQFLADTGCTIAGAYGAVGAMRARLEAGEPCDLVLLTSAIIGELARDGRVVASSIADIGAVPTAIAVRSADPLPPIGDEEALRRALLAADAILLPDPTLATAGIHFADVLRRLGIERETATKLQPFPNGAAAMHALAEFKEAHVIGCTQASEIIATPGVLLVGNLPPGFDLATTYTAAITAATQTREQAGAFVECLVGAGSADHRRRCGLV